MDIKFVEALIEWTKQGSRCVDIKYDNYIHKDEFTVKVWCYDYVIMAGKYASCIKEIPTNEELLEKTIKDNEEEYQRLIARQKKSGLRPRS